MENLPANVTQMAQALAQSAAMAGSAGSSDPYMKFTKTGEWVYGVEGTEVEEGSEWAVNPLGFAHGWTAWGTEEHGTDGQNMGEVMVPATQPMPAEGSLPEVKGKWTKAVGMQLRCTTGEDTGTQVLFKTNSLGGRKAYAALLQSVANRITTNPETCMPVVVLNTDSYKHKSYGKIFTPVMEVVRWVSHTDGEPAAAEANKLAAPAATTEAPAPAEEPRRRRRRAV